MRFAPTLLAVLVLVLVQVLVQVLWRVLWLRVVQSGRMLLSGQFSKQGEVDAQDGHCLLQWTARTTGVAAVADAVAVTVAVAVAVAVLLLAATQGEKYVDAAERRRRAMAAKRVAEEKIERPPFRPQGQVDSRPR